VKFGLDVPTAGEWAQSEKVVELAVEADRAGWDGFFLWDIFLPAEESQPIIDPWVTLGAVASETERILIGAMVTPLPRRQPWEVARQVATLDQLSHGRVVFGAGLGWRTDEFTRFGANADLRQRAEQLDESLELLERFWTGETVAFRGRHYQVHGVRLLPTTAQKPRPPIWLAAGWPQRAPLRRASRWDGVCLMTNNQTTEERLSPAEVREAVDHVVARRGDLNDFDVAVNVFTPEEPDGGVAITNAMEEAGATWTIELSPQTFAEHLDLARRGPASTEGRSHGRGNA
jgi:alkanesulfonate monooxygenase SsuD/methylene tetrahydromethanopterin reductase-like flavin-dependent oxidoreductase (luciferase family)